jgi:predicted  nucleic acid-binding Zn-ribbon protein
MRLQQHLDIIEEKVSKKEKQEALKNDNILIGCEFEFKLDEQLDDNSEMQELYEKAYNEYLEYDKDIEKYEEAYEEYLDDIRKEHEKLDELETKLSELEDAIESDEDAIVDYEDEISSIESDVKHNLWEPTPDGPKYGVEITTPEQEIDIINKRIDDINKNLKKWEREKEDLNNDIETLEQHIQYMEDEGIYEEADQYHPVFSKNYMPYYFEYMQDYMGIELPDYVEPGEKLEYQPYPLDENDGYGVYGDIVNAVESSGILNNAPFDDYEIGEYGDVDQRPGSTTWAIENDESVEGGLEVKNPPMELPDFVPDMLKDMFSWIDDIGYTDGSCGFHVHMSLKKSNGIDRLKLLLFVEEDYIYNAFTERRNSSYVKSVKDKLKSGGQLKETDVKKLFNTKKLKLKLASEHFDGVNVIDFETGHVEFRYMGGSSYHRDFKKVVDVISMYAYWLSLAADPEFKKKEYIHKLSRILNKTKMFEYYALLQTILMLLEIDKGLDNPAIDSVMETKLNTLYNKYIKKYNTLKQYYKLDKNTLRMLIDNNNFMESVSDNIKKIFDTIKYDYSATISKSIIQGDLMYIRRKLPNKL